MNKLLLRLGAVGVVAAGTVWVVRKYRANKGQTEELVQQGVAQVTELAKKVQTHFDVAMTQLATSWLAGPPANQKSDESEDKKPADQYTNSDPLLDDGGTRNDAA